MIFIYMVKAGYQFISTPVQRRKKMNSNMDNIVRLKPGKCKHHLQLYSTDQNFVRWPSVSPEKYNFLLAATFSDTTLWHNRFWWNISHQTRRLCEEYRIWGRHWRISKITIESLVTAIIINWKLLCIFLAATKDPISYLNPCILFKWSLEKK